MTTDSTLTRRAEASFHVKRWFGHLGSKIRVPPLVSGPHGGGSREEKQLLKKEVEGPRIERSAPRYLGGSKGDEKTFMKRDPVSRPTEASGELFRQRSR